MLSSVINCICPVNLTEHVFRINFLLKIIFILLNSQFFHKPPISRLLLTDSKSVTFSYDPIIPYSVCLSKEKPPRRIANKLISRHAPQSGALQFIIDDPRGCPVLFLFSLFNLPGVNRGVLTPQLASQLSCPHPTVDFLACFLFYFFFFALCVCFFL